VPQLTWQFIAWLVGGIFYAGITYAVILQLRKDVNGIGRVMRRDRWNHMLAEMVQLEDREDRQRLADLMREQ
jgi:hypothetical protein